MVLRPFSETLDALYSISCCIKVPPASIQLVRVREQEKQRYQIPSAHVVGQNKL